MARTIQEIENSILLKLQETVLGAELTSTSNTAIWRLWVWIFAFCGWVLESLWDVFRTELNTEIAKSRVHTRDWYRGKALGFMYGVPIIPGTDLFNTAGMTDEEITASKIVAQAAAVKLISDAGYGILRIKVAKKAGASLAPLSDQEFVAFREYMNRHVCDAGTQLVSTTGTGDDLKLEIDAYYDPLVISATGARLDGQGATPLKDAINNFIQGLNFNGVLVLSDLQQHLKAVEGFEAINIKVAASKYAGFTYESDTLANVGLIDEIRIADSGYFKLDESVFNVQYKMINE